jgi:hypothetical protein
MAISVRGALSGQPAKADRGWPPTLSTISRHVVSLKNNDPALIESIVFP